MGVDFSYRIVLGLPLYELKDDFQKNGIDIEKFIDEMYNYDFIETYDGYTGANLENAILGYSVGSFEYGWSEIGDNNKNKEINLNGLEESRYFTFIKSVFETKKAKLYGSVCVW